MTGPLIRSIRLDGLLSFAPGTPAFELQPLNVLIGPNGSGKSNLIEAVELLRSMPTDFAASIRDGGGVREWLWKGDLAPKSAKIDVEFRGPKPSGKPVRHVLEFTEVQSRVEILDESIEQAELDTNSFQIFSYYRFRHGDPMVSILSRDKDGSTFERQIDRSSIRIDQTILSQRRDPDLYPELAWLSEQLSSIQTFREWSFGRFAAVRRPQRTDLPDDVLLPDCRNLALVLNQIEHTDDRKLNELIPRFLPSAERLSTRVSGATIQLYLHEVGLFTPTPATRLSDGTIRFLALLATLLTPTPPPLICIEEPELGLHPDVMPLIAELLVEASTRSQLIVTTHSDALISALTEHVDSVVTCERVGDGTELRRLDAGRLAHWLDRYRLGDLWRIGELGANP